jgi:hypothetical protein
MLQEYLGVLSKESCFVTTKMKAWKKPELVVLVRSRPEEAVLAACKASGGGAGAVGPNGSNCARPAPGCVIVAAS